MNPGPQTRRETIKQITHNIINVGDKMIFTKVITTILTGVIAISAMSQSLLVSQSSDADSALTGVTMSAAKDKRIPKKTAAEIAVERAKELIGKPYRFGGEDEKTGFDSSGLVRSCFKAAGVEIPRKSSEIYRVAELIDEEELRPGDLVFYSPRNRRDGQVVSVSIYVGDGKVIHSANVESGVELRELEKEKKEMFFCFGRLNTDKPLVNLR